MRKPNQPKIPQSSRVHQDAAKDAQIFAGGGEIRLRQPALRDEDSVSTASLYAEVPAFEQGAEAASLAQNQQNGGRELRALKHRLGFKKRVFSAAKSNLKPEFSAAEFSQTADFQASKQKEPHSFRETGFPVAAKRRFFTGFGWKQDSRKRLFDAEFEQYSAELMKKDKTRASFRHDGVKKSLSSLAQKPGREFTFAKPWLNWKAYFVKPAAATDSLQNNGESAISLDARLAERRSEQRRIIIRRLGILVGIIFAFLLLLWLLFAAPFARFNAGSVKIEGVEAPSLISKTQVLSIADQYDGKSLLLLGNSDLSRELREIPEVAAVELETSLFFGAKIILTPAKPVFCIPHDVDCSAVNARGQFMKANLEDLETVPRLGEIPEGKKQQKVVLAAIDLLNTINPQVKEMIAQVNYSSVGQFSFVLKDGRNVNWGISEKNELKSQILQVLLQEAEKHNFDISVPEAPVAN